ncbi:hypothetical protein B0H14DRAFT_3896546 [Mycena olivaceomarginata]|nr:hypothetical protein B0H14DRAFT_3896546 [Mycena olivaceomarginata]
MGPESGHFPQELINLVVDNLHEDIATLKSCSLAAPTFVTSARIHIFKHIEITPPKRNTGLSPCQKLLDLLTSSPHLAPLVDDLCIVLIGPDAQTGPWIEAEATLPIVLSLLHLKRISLVENAPGALALRTDSTMDWNRLGRPLRSALAAIFSSPRLESVHLRGIRVESPFQLLSLFSGATSLEEMSLSRVYLRQRVGWPKSSPWHPRLRSLLLSDVRGHPFYRYLLNPQIDLSHVNSLTVTSDSQFPAKEKLLRAALHSEVEHLRLGHPQRSPVGNDFPKSILGANLRSIHFFSPLPFMTMAEFFDAFCLHDSRLESIIFQGTEGRDPVFDGPLLNATIRSALIHFPCLETVEIWMSVWFISEWSDVIRAALPSLVERGFLRMIEHKAPVNGVYHGFE